MPRPTLLTKEIQEKICKAIREGNWFEVACRAAGVAPATAYDWIKRGMGRSSRRTSLAYVEFVEAVKQAEAECEIEAVKEFYQSGSPGEFLARRFPDRWSRRDRVEHSGPGGGAITIKNVIVRRPAEPAADD